MLMLIKDEWSSTSLRSKTTTGFRGILTSLLHTLRAFLKTSYDLQDVFSYAFPVKVKGKV